MGERSRFQRDVEVVMRALARQAREDAWAEGEKLYQKFNRTDKEPVKLAVALRGFFMDNGVTEVQREDYGAYLREWVVPAVEALIAEDDVEKIGELESRGWFGETQLEGFIRLSREWGKTGSMVWLLHLKREKYGYSDREFIL